MTTLMKFPVHQDPGILVSCSARHRCACPLKIGLLALLLGFMGTVSIFGQFRSTQWNADSGLPQNSVRGIIQTPDGYLWVATRNGVARFDGVRFTVFDKSNTREMTSNRFVAMAKGAGGDFWLVSEDGNIIRYHDSHFGRLDSSNGVRPDSVASVTSDDDNSIWIVSDEALYRWNDRTDRFDRPKLEKDDVRFRAPWWMGTSIWALHDNELLYLLHGAIHRSALPSWLVRKGITTAAIEKNGTIWVALKSGEVSRSQNGRYQKPSRQIEIPIQDKDKQGWVLRVHGLINRDISFPSQDHKSSVSMDVMMTDSEGNVWIGTETDGMFRIQKQSITTYSAPQGLGGRNVYLTLGAANGDIWIGTWPRSLSRIRDGKVTTFGARDNVPGYLSALAEDHKGDIWIGNPEGIRVLHEGRITIPKNIPDLKALTVQAIYQSDAGTFLIGTTQGLYIVNGSTVSVMKSRDGLASNDVRVIIKDHNGDIWMGGYGGVTQLSSHLIPKARWTEQNGLPSGNVRSIYEDPAHNIWIGTYDGGLGLLRNGKWTTLNATHGLYDNGVFQILEDRHQNFWMSSNRGIYRTSKADLYAFADGKKTRVQSVGYGKADGMLNIECNGGFWPSGAIDKRGFLWFPTQDGVAVINPDILDVPKQGPRTVIESVAVDHADIGSVPRVVLKPDQQDLEIRYTALSFSKPEQIEFRYKLEGIDREWEYAGRRRTAYYKHLPPGSYVFHVTSVNSDGVWSKEDQRLAIDVVPHFFQRWWFIASLVLALFAAAWAFWNHRIRQLQRTKAAQKAFSQQLIASQEVERRRIAAELHDGLSQHLVVIKNLALFLLKPKGGRASEDEKRLNLEEISSEASAAMDEARSMLYALRPFQLERVGLSRAIQGLVQTAGRASGIQFTLDLDDIDGAFPQELQINFFRIAQEAVNNIMKHSNATTASITAKFDHAALHLSISDNGKGLDTDIRRMTPGSGGFGLTGIQERVDLLNGSLRISSNHGSGTLLSMTFLTRPTGRE